MDLVGIFHVVDTPSTGKRGFNFIYTIGLVQFTVLGLIQFLVLLLHPLVFV